MLPPRLRFPLLVLFSLTISSFLYSLVSPFTTGDLATVSKSRDNWWEIAGLLGWKATQLAIGWFGGFDSTISSFIRGDPSLNMHRYRLRCPDLPDPRAISLLPLDLLQH